MSNLRSRCLKKKKKKKKKNKLLGSGSFRELFRALRSRQSPEKEKL
jgi:hypothetical protein